MFFVNIDVIRYISDIYYYDAKQLYKVIYVIDKVLADLRSLEGLEDEIKRLERTRTKVKIAITTMEQFSRVTSEIASVYDHTEKAVSSLFNFTIFIRILDRMRFIIPSIIMRFKIMY